MDTTVLFISPYLQDAQAIGSMLAEASVVLKHATNLKDAIVKLETGRFSVVLTEAKLDDGTWRDILSLTRLHGSELLVTDSWADARFWAEAINLGAFDVLAQPFRGAEVRRVVASACAQAAQSMALGAAS